MKVTRREYVTALVILFVSSALGCAAVPPCKEVLVNSKGFRLVEIRTEQIDNIPVRVGQFEITNTHSASFVLHGWMRKSGFLVEYPTSWIQLKRDRWEDVVPMIGSFLSVGDEKLELSTGQKRIVLARVDFGVPAGRHEARIGIRTASGVCLFSSPFSLDVSK